VVFDKRGGYLVGKLGFLADEIAISSLEFSDEVGGAV